MNIPIHRLLKSALIPGLIALSLCAANPASAASILDVTSPDLSTLEDDAASIPQSDLSGWFETYDPSNEWTDAANIATLESWLALAEEINDNPSADATPQLTSAPSSATALVPEPATLGLLGIALAILLTYVAIRRPHRFLRN